jgi:hypothetical protein
MRLRSIPLLAVALTSWLLVWRFMEEVDRSGFGYELGSVAFPLPGYIRLLVLGGFASMLVGLPTLLVDFIRWIRNGKA